MRNGELVGLLTYEFRPNSICAADECVNVLLEAEKAARTPDHTIGIKDVFQRNDRPTWDNLALSYSTAFAIFPPKSGELRHVHDQNRAANTQPRLFAGLAVAPSGTLVGEFFLDQCVQNDKNRQKSVRTKNWRHLHQDHMSSRGTAGLVGTLFEQMSLENNGNC